MSFDRESSRRTARKTALVTSTVLVWLVLPVKISGQEWRGIQLLKSNCEDVKRALRVDKCEYPETTYHLTGETVAISFQNCSCPTVCIDEIGGWNVPRGTVRSIVRNLHKPVPIADFNVNGAKWISIQTDFIGQIIYTNKDEGIRISAIDEGVVTITYYPPVDKFKHLRCPNCFSPKAKNNDIKSPVFIAYGGVMTFDREKYRLNDFALQLRKLGQRSKAYIVAYDECTGPKGIARDRALRAKEYLRTQGIDSRRIVIVDGGRRELMLIELHGRKRNMPPPKTLSSIYPRN